MRRRYPVVAFCGLARSGKDTCADLVLAKFGGYRYSLADPLRAMLKVGLGVDLDDPYWKERKETPIPAFGNKSPRQMMQWLGTEWGRQLIDNDLWVTLAKQRFLDAGPGMVIADVRYENEAEWVRSMGGILIHVTRPGVQKVNNHVSEAGVSYDPKTDRTLLNDGSLEDLRASLFSILGGDET